MHISNDWYCIFSGIKVKCKYLLNSHGLQTVGLINNTNRALALISEVIMKTKSSSGIFIISF